MMGAWILLAGLASLAALALYIRLAPSDPARWHTDPADPALSLGEGRFLLRPEGGDAAGPLFPFAPQALLEKLDAVAMAAPRTSRLAGSPAEGRITWITRSALWGFPDYTTAAAIPESQGARLLIHARLRFGRRDFGVNRARVRNWLARLSLAS
jgi:hypothetical protein